MKHDWWIDFIDPHHCGKWEEDLTKLVPELLAEHKRLLLLDMAEAIKGAKIVPRNPLQARSLKIKAINETFHGVIQIISDV